MGPLQPSVVSGKLWLWRHATTCRRQNYG